MVLESFRSSMKGCAGNPGMKILFLSQRFLLPMDTGGKIRTGKLLAQLSEANEITLVSNVESPKDDPYLPEMKKLCHRFVRVPWKETSKHSRFFLLRLLWQMISLYPVSVLNDYSSKLRQAVERECRDSKYDLMVCDFVQSALNVRNIKGLPVVLFQHNVESIILKRHVEQTKNVLAKLFWWLQWKKMHRFEGRACRSFDSVVAVSDLDAAEFVRLYAAKNVSTISTGIDTSHFAPLPDVSEEPNSLVFCGSMDWLPNEDAMIFFFREIMPLLGKGFPDLRLTIVGRNPSPSFRKLAKSYPGVTLTGWVDDTRPYIARSAIFIVPIRVGGGTRMKIYEGMAMSKAVVSTSTGAEGLSVAHGENVVLAETPEMFSREISRLLVDPVRRAKLGRVAREHVCSHFSWVKVAKEFQAVCESATLSPRGERRRDDLDGIASSLRSSQ